MVGPLTAGVIIVGDEVLSGSVQDSNSHFISERLHRLGVRLRKVAVLPDDVEAIAAEVSEFAGKYDVVVTSGGVGPTHDDRTYEAVARAFGVPLQPNAEVGEMLQDGQSKMALVPAGGRLHRIRDTRDTTITKPIVQARPLT